MVACANAQVSGGAGGGGRGRAGAGAGAGGRGGGSVASHQAGWRLAAHLVAHLEQHGANTPELVLLLDAAGNRDAVERRTALTC